MLRRRAIEYNESSFAVMMDLTTLSTAQNHLMELREKLAMRNAIAKFAHCPHACENGCNRHEQEEQTVRCWMLVNDTAIGNNNDAFHPCSCSSLHFGEG